MGWGNCGYGKLGLVCWGSFVVNVLVILLYLNLSGWLVCWVVVNLSGKLVFVWGLNVFVSY